MAARDELAGAKGGHQLNPRGIGGHLRRLREDRGPPAAPVGELGATYGTCGRIGGSPAALTGGSGLAEGRRRKDARRRVAGCWCTAGGGEGHGVATGTLVEVEEGGRSLRKAGGGSRNY